jgi:Spy/CpxP family protein refolding chaperone
MRRVLLGVLALCACLPAMAQTSSSAQPHAAHGPYAGQQTRAITSLSEEDLAELRRGAGWGLAKPAELNGMPGPAHLLELKDEIGLSADQIGRVTAIFDAMRARAIAEGDRLIAAEADLDAAFRDGSIDETRLRDLLSRAERSRSALRYVHLSAHLQTPAVLTSAQISRYNTLRGYRTDPGAAVPDGHDPAMWRAHNGCGR